MTAVLLVSCARLFVRRRVLRPTGGGAEVIFRPASLRAAGARATNCFPADNYFSTSVQTAQELDHVRPRLRVGEVEGVRGGIAARRVEQTV